MFLVPWHHYLNNTLVFLRGDLCGSDGEWVETVFGFDAAEDGAMVSLVDGGVGRRMSRRPRGLAWIVFGVTEATFGSCVAVDGSVG